MTLPIRKLHNMRPRAILAPGAQPQSQQVAQEKYFVRLVTGNLQYKLIIASLLEGITPSAIAAHFAQNSWIDVKEKTFAEAIRTFKKMHPEALIEAAPEGLNKLVDPNRPSLDTKGALMQLLRMQQLRLGIEVGNEKGINKLFNTTAKEVEVTRSILETIAKMDGKIMDGSGRGGMAEPSDVIEDLNKIKKDNLARDRMHTLLKQAVEVKG